MSCYVDAVVYMNYAQK